MTSVKGEKSESVIWFDKKYLPPMREFSHSQSLQYYIVDTPLVV